MNIRVQLLERLAAETRLRLGSEAKLLLDEFDHYVAHYDPEADDQPSRRLIGHLDVYNALLARYDALRAGVGLEGRHPGILSTAELLQKGLDS